MPAREQGHQRSRDYGALSSIDIEALNASSQLDTLEAQGDQALRLAVLRCCGRAVAAQPMPGSESSSVGRRANVGTAPTTSGLGPP